MVTAGQLIKALQQVPPDYTIVEVRHYPNPDNKEPLMIIVEEIVEIQLGTIPIKSDCNTKKVSLRVMFEDD